MNTEAQPKEKPTPEAIQHAKIKALTALKNQPTTYDITVIDNEPLPVSLKDRKEISFVVKPPTFATLTDLALIVEKLPPELFESQEMTKLAMSNLNKVLEMIAVLSHGNTRKKIPDWYVPFLRTNLTVEEALMIWQECAAKLQTDFFLPFFQIAKAMNPMSMKMKTKKTKGSTPSS